MNNPAIAVETPEVLLTLLRDFKHHLDQEQQMLLESTADNIDTLASRKYDLLQKINGISPTLLRRLNEDADPDSDTDAKAIQQIKHLVQNCKEQNRENGVLVVQGLKVCRNSLELLKYSTNQNHTELYDPNGLSTSELSKRDLGQA